MTIYQIDGTRSSGKTFTMYAEAPSEGSATKKMLDQDPSITKWSASVLEEAPSEAYIMCPDCSGRIKNPLVWVE